MIIKPSPLKLVQFFITRIEVDFTDPESYDSFNLKEEIEKYHVDIDFSIKRPTADGFHVFVRTHVNKGSLRSGYEVKSECLGIFKLSEEVPDEDIKKLINTSALVMTLNYLRAYIANTTSGMPWGQYLLPSIDMQDLHMKKVQLIKDRKSQKKSLEGKKNK
jgi:preprotein translocase subunit SecB